MFNDNRHENRQGSEMVITNANKNIVAFLLSKVAEFGSPEAIEEQTNLNARTLRYWMKGERVPRGSSIKRIADEFGVTTDEIYNYSPQKVFKETPGASVFNVPVKNPRTGDYGTLEDTGRTWPFPTYWLNKKAANVDSLVLTQIYEDANAPTIQPEDLILIDTDDTRLSIGTVYALDLEGYVILRKVEMKPGKAILKGENPSCEDIVIDRPDTLPTIIGKVVWTGRS